MCAVSTRLITHRTTPGCRVAVLATQPRCSLGRAHIRRLCVKGIADMHLYLVRHGESEGNVKGLIPGRSPDTDYPLTDKGRAQALATARRFQQLQRPSIVYHSPARRAKETAEP